jgi:dTDP-4-amino-4,6-dideoxygalactose transaminase
MIGKLPAAGLHKRLFQYHESARAAFRAFLESANPGGRGPVLLPAYVGWSAREGSGVFDPLRETGTPYGFYRVDSRLHVEVQDFEDALRRERPCGAVLIHYFGCVDPSYPQLVRCARDRGVWVLEDEAHALLTDLAMGTTGRRGDVAILSLHKLLPVPDGGVLIWNDPHSAPAGSPMREVPPDRLWEFDLPAIAARRRENTLAWLDALRPLEEWIRPLWGPPAAGEVPQSLPMLVSGFSRDALYHELNAAGIGVVSLYHTLIDPISPADYPESHGLSRTIINFPVHQDVTRADILEATPVVERTIHRLRRAR